MAHQQNTSISTIDKANKKRRTLSTECCDQVGYSTSLRFEDVGDAASNADQAHNNESNPYEAYVLKLILFFELGNVPKQRAEYYSGPDGSPY